MRLKLSSEGYNAMLTLQQYANKGTLDPLLKELVKLRASQLNQCAFCLDMHSKDARALGEEEQRIHVLPAWREAPFYSPRERAALAWCESLTMLPQTGAPDDIYHELEQHFSADEIMELTFTIVAINSWNRLMVGFQSEVGQYVSKKKPATI